MASAKFTSAMLVCTDLGRSQRFYRDVLGLAPRANGGGNWAEFDLGKGQTLGLYPAEGTLRVAHGSLQLAFVVVDVDRFVTDARLAGATVLQDPHEQAAGRVAVVADPDGYPLRIVSPKVA